MSDRPYWCEICARKKECYGITLKPTCFVPEEWICNNKESDAYSLMTDYNDGCEEFEPKGVR